jgi:hypothetical protein
MEEAADRIGISLDEFKRRARTDAEFKTLKIFRDGATIRYRTAEIDELARVLGAASDPGLQLGQPGAAKPEPGSNDFLLPSDNSDDIPLSLSLDDSSEIGAKKSGSDSDVRLDVAGKKAKKAKDDGSGESEAITEEINLDLAGPSSGKIKAGGSSGKLVAPKSGGSIGGPKSGKIQIPDPSPEMGGDSSSEFELSLDSDSDSFELQLNTDSSEEIDLGSPTTGTPRGAKSGIVMSQPSDSGVSLEKGKEVKDDSSDSLDFELSAESPTEAKSATKKNLAADSDSEFELSLEDDSGVTSRLAQKLESEAAEAGDKGDIFETDFDVPKLGDSDSAVVTADDESGSEVVAIDGADTDLENSDFDLALDEADVVAEDDESASQVMLVDEDEAPARSPVEESDEAVLVEEEEELVTPAGPPARWTGFPVAMIALSFLVIFFGTFMGFESARAMWGARSPTKAAAPITDGVAGVLGMEPKATK